MTTVPSRFGREAHHPARRGRLTEEFELLGLRLRLRMAEISSACAPDPSGPFGGLVITDQEAVRLLDELDARWHGQPETAARTTAEEGGYWQAATRLHERLDAESAEDSDADDPLVALAGHFQLTPFEQRCLIMALAPDVDRRYERVYAYLHDDVTRREPTVALALEVLCVDPEKRWQLRRCFRPESPLLRHRLLHLSDRTGTQDGPLLAKTMRVPEQVADFLLNTSPVDSSSETSLNERLAPAPPVGVLAWKPLRNWEDLVLPDDQRAQLEEVCVRAHHGATVYGEWGFESRSAGGKGVKALFFGPPGTGKTLGAEVVAAALDRLLWRVDLAQVVSKYVGETEKNLDSVFRAAEGNNIVLFFDEADALFGKRTEVKDAHDRYANQEVSYLLQRIEQYEGVAILATNLRQNVDEAFLRRMTFVIEFPFPDETQRQRIWSLMFPSQSPRGEEVEFGLLARKIHLSGGHIRNIALAAAFSAAEESGAIHMRHLWHAARREHQKLGQAWSAPVEDRPSGNAR